MSFQLTNGPRDIDMGNIKSSSNSVRTNAIRANQGRGKSNTSVVFSKLLMFLNYLFLINKRFICGSVFYVQNDLKLKIHFSLFSSLL